MDDQLKSRFADVVLVTMTLAAAFVLPLPAHAHLGHLVLRAERYLKIDAAPGEARVVVSLMLGPSETRRALEPADTDEDGSVSRREADAYLVGWAAELGREVTVTLDAAPAQGVTWRDGVLEPIGRIAAQPVTVELIAHVPLPGGLHTLSVHDAMDTTRLERTDVAFDARDGATLVHSGIGTAPRDAERELSFGPELDPRGGRVFTAVLRTPQDPTSPAWFALGAVAGVALIAGVVIFTRARARASSRSR